MKIICQGIGLLWLVFLVDVSCAVTLTDDSGRVVTLEHPPQRIVSLAPNVTEMLFAIGAGSRIVGVDEYSDYPPTAKDLPRIGSSARIDIERVVALKPDLVIGWLSGNPRSDIAKLEELGITVYITETSSLDNIADQLIQLGQLIGSSDSANKAAEKFRQRLTELQTEYSGKPRVTVFYQVWDQPLMTVNGKHFISNAVRLCGGVSLFAEMGTLAPTVSKEAVIAANPQVIITGDSDSHSTSLKSMWGSWKTIDAVKYGNLFVIPSDLIARPTPRILNGVTAICKALEQARVNMRQ